MKELLKKELIHCMKEFDKENRGNRISKEIIAGLGMYLENMLVMIVEKNNAEKGDKNGR